MKKVLKFVKNKKNSFGVSTSRSTSSEFNLDSSQSNNSLSRESKDPEPECSNNENVDISKSDHQNNLFQAAKQGKLADLKKNLQFCDVNFVDGSGKTVLHYAALNGRSDCVKYLLNHSVNPCIQDSDGMTAFLIAIEAGHIECVELLIDVSGPKHLVNNNSENALHIAVRNGRCSITDLLIEKGFDISSLNKREQTCLHLAVASQFTNIVSLLVQHGSSVNVLDIDNKSPLMLASSIGNMEIVDILVNANATLNIEDVKGMTAMDYALINGHNELFNTLNKLHKPNIPQHPAKSIAAKDKVDSNDSESWNDSEISDTVDKKSASVVSILSNNDSAKRHKRAYSEIRFNDIKNYSPRSSFRLLEAKEYSISSVETDNDDKSCQIDSEEKNVEANNDEIDKIESIKPKTCTNNINVDVNTKDQSIKTNDNSNSEDQPHLKNNSKHVLSPISIQETKNSAHVTIQSPRTKSEFDVLSVSSVGKEGLSIRSSVTASPQSGIIPPPCKPLRSLEYLQSLECATSDPFEELKKSHFLTLGSLRTRHISFTEKNPSKDKYYTLQRRSYHDGYVSEEKFEPEDDKVRDKVRIEEKTASPAVSIKIDGKSDKTSTSASGSDWGSDKSLPLHNLSSRNSNSPKSDQSSSSQSRHSSILKPLKSTALRMFPSKKIDGKALKSPQEHSETQKQFSKSGSEDSEDKKHSDCYDDSVASSTKLPFLAETDLTESPRTVPSISERDSYKLNIDDILNDSIRINEELESYNDALTHLDEYDLAAVNQKSKSLPRTAAVARYDISNKGSYSLPRSLTADEVFASEKGTADFLHRSFFPWRKDRVTESLTLPRRRVSLMKRIRYVFEKSKRILSPQSDIGLDNLRDDFKKRSSSDKIKTDENKNLNEGVKKRYSDAFKDSNKYCTFSGVTDSNERHVKYATDSLKYEKELQDLAALIKCNNETLEGQKREHKLREEVNKWKKQYEEMLHKVEEMKTDAIATHKLLESKSSEILQQSENILQKRSMLQGDDPIEILRNQYENVEKVLLEQNEKLETLIEKLQLELTDSAKKQSDLESQLKKVKNELDSTKKGVSSETEDHKKEKEMLCMEIEELKNIISEKNKSREVQKLRDENEYLKEKLCLAENEIEQIREGLVSESSQDGKSYKDMYSTLQKIYTDFVSEFETFKKDKMEEYENVKADNCILNSKILVLEKQLENNQVSYEMVELEKYKIAKEDEIEMIKDENRHLQNMLSEKDYEIERLQKSLEEAKQNFKPENVESNKLLTECDGLSSRFNKMLQENEKLLETFYSKLNPNTTSVEVNSLREENRLLKRDFENTTRDLENCKQSVNEMSFEIKRVLNVLEENKLEISDIKTKNEVLKIKVTNVETQKDDLLEKLNLNNTEINTLQNKLKNAQTDYDFLQKKCVELEAQNSDYINSIKNYMLKLEENEIKMNSLIKQLELSKVEEEKLKQEVKNVTASYETKLNDKSKEIELKKAQSLKSLETECSELKGVLEKLKNDFMQMSNSKNIELLDLLSKSETENSMIRSKLRQMKILLDDRFSDTTRSVDRCKSRKSSDVFYVINEILSHVINSTEDKESEKSSSTKMYKDNKIETNVVIENRNSDNKSIDNDLVKQISTCQKKSQNVETILNFFSHQSDNDKVNKNAEHCYYHTTSDYNKELSGLKTSEDKQKKEALIFELYNSMVSSQDNNNLNLRKSSSINVIPIMNDGDSIIVQKRSSKSSENICLRSIRSDELKNSSEINRNKEKTSQVEDRISNSQSYDMKSENKSEDINEFKTVICSIQSQLSQLQFQIELENTRHSNLEKQVKRLENKLQEKNEKMINEQLQEFSRSMQDEFTENKKRLLTELSDVEITLQGAKNIIRYLSPSSKKKKNLTDSNVMDKSSDEVSFKKQFEMLSEKNKENLQKLERENFPNECSSVSKTDCVCSSKEESSWMLETNDYHKQLDKAISQHRLALDLEKSVTKEDNFVEDIKQKFGLH